jgi:hypothetical protein
MFALAATANLAFAAGPSERKFSAAKSQLTMLSSTAFG